MYTVTPREDTAPQEILDIAEALGWRDTLQQDIANSRHLIVCLLVEDGWCASSCDQAEDDACAYIEQVLDRVFDKLFHIKKYV